MASTETLPQPIVLPRARDHRLDLLKAIAIVMVVFWHFQQGRQPGPAHVPNPDSLIQLYNYQVSLVAVPAFLLVSIMLFMQRLQPGDTSYLRARFVRIGGAFAFWFAVQTALYVALSGALPELSWRLLRTGGPKLPVPSAGASVFYFLYVLLFLIAFAWLYELLPRRVRDVLGALVVTASVMWFGWMNLQGAQIEYFDVRNFVMYVPIAGWLVEFEDGWTRGRWLFVVAWVVAAIGDVELLARGTRVSLYGRPVVVLGTLALVTLVLRSRLGQQRAVTFLSLYSLGIFATHKYWYALFTVLSARLGYTTAGTTLLHPVWLVVMTLAAVTTIAGVALAGRMSSLKRLVS